MCQYGLSRLLSVVQTYGVTLEQLNTTWVIDRARKRDEHLSCGHVACDEVAPLEDEEAADLNDEDAEELEEVGEGSIYAFNVFVQERTFWV